MRFRTGRGLREICGIRKLLGKEAGDFSERAKFRCRHGLENNLFAMFLDQNFFAGKAKRSWQADGLTAAMLEYFCSAHIYILYLFTGRSSDWLSLSGN